MPRLAKTFAVDLASEYRDSKSRKKGTERQPKYSEEELLFGITFFSDNKEKFLSQKGDTATGIKRAKLWKEAALKMTEISGVTRQHTNVKQKIMALRSKYKGVECERVKRLGLTGGGTPVESGCSSPERSSDDDLDGSGSLEIREQIKEIAISTIPKVQITGFAGIDIMKRYVDKKAAGTKTMKPEELVDKYRPRLLKLAASINSFP